MYSGLTGRQTPGMKGRNDQCLALEVPFSLEALSGGRSASWLREGFCLNDIAADRQTNELGGIL